MVIVSVSGSDDDLCALNEGRVVNDLCWFEGEIGESCVDVCSDKGGNVGECDEAYGDATTAVCLEFHPDASISGSRFGSGTPFYYNNYCYYGSYNPSCEAVANYDNAKRFCACNADTIVAELVVVSPKDPVMVAPKSYPGEDHYADVITQTPEFIVTYEDTNGNNGEVEFRVATSEAGCIAGTDIVSSGSVATTTAHEDVSWISDALSDGRYYWCAKASNAEASTDWVSMGHLQVSSDSKECGSWYDYYYASGILIGETKYGYSKEQCVDYCSGLTGVKSATLRSGDGRCSCHGYPGLLRTQYYAQKGYLMCEVECETDSDCAEGEFCNDDNECELDPVPSCPAGTYEIEWNTEYLLGGNLDIILGGEGQLAGTSYRFATDCDTNPCNEWNTGYVSAGSQITTDHFSWNSGSSHEWIFNTHDAGTPVTYYGYGSLWDGPSAASWPYEIQQNIQDAFFCYEPITPNPCLENGGKKIDGFCWIEGESGQNCVDVCNYLGGNFGNCDEAKTDYTGSTCLKFHPDATIKHQRFGSGAPFYNPSDNSCTPISQGDYSCEAIPYYPGEKRFCACNVDNMCYYDGDCYNGLCEDGVCVYPYYGFESVVEVSGDISPEEAKGFYLNISMINDQVLYKHKEKEWYIYTSGSSWVIADWSSGREAKYWSRDSNSRADSVLGEYDNVNGAGNAIVSSLDGNTIESNKRYLFDGPYIVCGDKKAEGNEECDAGYYHPVDNNVVYNGDGFCCNEMCKVYRPDFRIDSVKPIQVVDGIGRDIVPLVLNKDTITRVDISYTKYECESFGVSLNKIQNIEVELSHGKIRSKRGTAYPPGYTKTISEYVDCKDGIIFDTNDISAKVGTTRVIAEVDPHEEREPEILAPIELNTRWDNIVEIEAPVKKTHGLTIIYVPFVHIQGEIPDLNYITKENRFIQATYPIAIGGLKHYVVKPYPKTYVMEEWMDPREQAPKVPMTKNPLNLIRATYSTGRKFLKDNDITYNPDEVRFVGLVPKEYYFPFYFASVEGGSTRAGYINKLVHSKSTALIRTMGQDSETATAHEIGHTYGLWADLFAIRSEEYHHYDGGRMIDWVSIYNTFSRFPAACEYPAAGNRKSCLMGSGLRGWRGTWVDQRCYYKGWEDLEEPERGKAEKQGAILYDEFAKISGDKEELIIISGYIMSRDGEIVLDPMDSMDGVSDDIEPGDYSIEFTDEGGATIEDVAFTLEFIEEEDGEDVAYFMVTVPFQDDMKSIRIKHNDEILKEVTKTDNSPVVSITSTRGSVLEWEASDIDSDELYYTVSYEDDGIWGIVDYNINETSIELDPEIFEQGESYLFRVRANDMFNEAVDEAEFEVEHNE